MLVRAVVTRKSKVTTGRRLPPIIPRTTTNPDAIPIKLMTTCKVVNASKLMPRIMMVSFRKCRVATQQRSQRRDRVRQASVFAMTNFDSVLSVV